MIGEMMTIRKTAQDILRRADGLKVLKTSSVGYMIALGAVEDALTHAAAPAAPVAAPAPSDVRAVFEHYMSDGGEYPKAIAKNDDGEYRLMVAASAWRTWQAAAEVYAPTAQGAA